MPDVKNTGDQSILKKQESPKSETPGIDHGNRMLAAAKEQARREQEGQAPPSSSQSDGWTTPWTSKAMRWLEDHHKRKMDKRCREEQEWEEAKRERSGEPDARSSKRPKYEDLSEAQREMELQERLTERFIKDGFAPFLEIPEKERESLLQRVENDTRNDKKRLFAFLLGASRISSYDSELRERLSAKINRDKSGMEDQLRSNIDGYSSHNRDINAFLGDFRKTVNRLGAIRNGTARPIRQGNRRRVG